MWALVTAGTPIVDSLKQRAELHIAQHKEHLPTDSRVILNNPVEIDRVQARDLEDKYSNTVWVCLCDPVEDD